MNRDRKHGVFKTWDEKGALISEIEYVQGKPVPAKEGSREN